MIKHLEIYSEVGEKAYREAKIEEQLKGIEMKWKEIFFVLTENKLITLDDHNENSMKNLLVKGVKRINEFDWSMNMPNYWGQSLKPDEYN